MMMVRRLVLFLFMVCLVAIGTSGSVWAIDGGNPDRPVSSRSAKVSQEVGPPVPPALMRRIWNPPVPVPPRPPGWGGNWPPERFTGLDECLDCVEHVLKITGYGERWRVTE